MNTPNQPPSDVEPSELFVRLTSGTRPHHVVDLPRKDPVTGAPAGRVRMMVLTQTEMIIAGAEAEKRTRKLLKDGLPKQDEAQLGYQDVYNNLVACEVLFRACRHIDDETLKRSAFRTPHEVGNAFSNDEIGVLYHHYLTVKHELGPIVATMTEEEIEAWIRVLGEGASAIPLDALSWGALTTLVRTMASRLLSSRTGSSSPGSPADDSKQSDEAPTDVE